MGGGQELPQADHGTDIENHSDELPTSSTETPLQQYQRPKCLEDFDFEAEELRKEAERQAAVIKERQDKQTYFFYGSLMDPQTAQQVLGLETPPTMRPAIFTKGGQLKMWGPFPALVTDEKPKLDIKGMACEVEGAERKDRLAAYEGDNYGEVSSCMIFVFRDDGSTDWVMGKMFDWAGSKEDLKDGTFDLEAYKAAKARVDAAEK